MASFTWTHDQVVKSIPLIQIQGWLCPYFSVIKLFQRLFIGSEYKVMLDSKPSLRHPDDPPRSFGTIFENAMMHFNHFIEPQEQGVVALPYLLYFMTHCLFFFRCLTPGHRALAATVTSMLCQHHHHRRLCRINTPHRHCGVSTLTATMTAAAMAAPLLRMTVTARALTA